MPFIGNQPALSYTSFAKQDFTTSATTSYTLDQPVANANELALFINFVRQEPTTAYTASGTTLTLTSATSASDDMYCVFLGKAVQTVNPPSGSVGISQLSATGTKNSTTFLRGDNTFAEANGKFESALLHVRDEKASGVNAGASVSGNNTRDLNTVVTNEITGASLSSNQITLPSGTYFIQASAPAFKPSGHKVILYNTTDTSNEVIGLSEYSGSGESVQTTAMLCQRFTITAAKVFELRHQISAAKATNGLGVGLTPTINIYANVMIWKVA